MSDIGQYVPGLTSLTAAPVTIDARHISGLSGTSTKTVATVSSGYGADYYTTGTNDNVQIQAAIDAVALLGGGRVFIRAGTYTCTQIVNLKSNIIFEGEGEATVLNFNTHFKWLQCPGITDFKILNMKISTFGQTSGNGLERCIDTPNCQRFEIAGCHLEAYGFGIFLDTGNGGAATGGIAIPTQDLRDAHIHNNVIHGACRNDLIGGGPPDDTQTTNVYDVIIEGNFISQDYSLNNNIYFNCIDIVRATRLRVDGNICEGTIYFGNERDPHQYSSISNNIVRQPAGLATAMTGIVIQDENNATAQSGQCKVVGNILYGGNIHISGKSGQPILNCEVSNNVIINNVALTTNDQTNTLSQRGVWLQYANNCLVSGNMCYGPSVTNNGITCDNASNCSITGNYVDGYANSLAQANTANGNLWQGNYLINFSSAAQTGITVGNTHYNFGLVSENSGTATIASGQTSIVVTHGLGFTPAAGNVMVTPTNTTSNDIIRFYIDTYTSTQFTIHVGADPGASTATFAWLARV